MYFAEFARNQMGAQINSMKASAIPQIFAGSAAPMTPAPAALPIRMHASRHLPRMRTPVNRELLDGTAACVRVLNLVHIGAFLRVAEDSHLFFG
jgi:hypothetical protein